MFRHTQVEGDPIAASEMAQQAALLDHPARSYRAFVEESAKAWRD